MTTFEILKFIFGVLFILCGLVIFFTELFGVFRFRYVLNRMHAAAMGDTLGISACLIGVLFFTDNLFTALKVVLILVFLWISSPISSHVLSRLEVATNEHLADNCTVYTNLQDLENELSENEAGGEI